MDHPLSAAVVSPKQIAQLSHPLAAANHYQWAIWEQWVLRDPSELTPSMASTIVERASHPENERIFRIHAETVVGIVRQTAGAFAYPPDPQRIVQRKIEQFTDWVNYAVTQPASKRKRWLAQCRIPFLDLSALMQESDYAEAAKDLSVIAEAGGLVLADPLPELKPHTDDHLERLRRLHKLCWHGPANNLSQTSVLVAVTAGQHPTKPHYGRNERRR